jgi:hypothetical protein
MAARRPSLPPGTPALAEPWQKPPAAPPMTKERQREWATNPGLLGFTEGVMTLDDPCNGGKHPHLTKLAQWQEFSGYVISNTGWFTA